MDNTKDLESEEAARKIARAKCVHGKNHYFKLDKPNGKTSGGVCAYCKDRQEFLNAPPDTYNNDGWQQQNTTTWINAKRGELQRNEN